MDFEKCLDFETIFQTYQFNFLSLQKWGPADRFFTDFFAKLNFVPTAHPMSTGDQPLIEVAPYKKNPLPFNERIISYFLGAKHMHEY